MGRTTLAVLYIASNPDLLHGVVTYFSKWSAPLWALRFFSAILLIAFHHGLLYALLYALLHALLNGLLYALLYGLLYGLLYRVYQAFHLLLHLTVYQALYPAFHRYMFKKNKHTRTEAQGNL